MIVCDLSVDLLLVLQAEVLIQISVAVIHTAFWGFTVLHVLKHHNNSYLKCACFIVIHIWMSKLSQFILIALICFLFYFIRMLFSPAGHFHINFRVVKKPLFMRHAALLLAPLLKPRRYISLTPGNSSLKLLIFKQWDQVDTFTSVWKQMSQIFSPWLGRQTDRQIDR